ncbi:aminomethyl-transferring glycine dehydrogenase subunit GcvPA [Haladaptatus cibarius]|uniref:aminomethyl-transferring glycine dehydrogenase subunit GcvPA n=1 Tax=Haladaptatus cibarius TaxID=453847 RepID=UPI000679B4F8|nr:aminomethyl-transferring glycine dehydrogenase subunit GcvPA [Haladaptatus cibarius]
MTNQFDQTNTEKINNCTGSPFTPHTKADVREMLDTIGSENVEELFDIPESIRFDDRLNITVASEQQVTAQLAQTLTQNSAQTEFLGRGHYSHYVPSIVDHISLRSEFLTSYTQYQPEITQGFLQALFEYQSLLVELTGLNVANCSMYDAATALGEAATLAARVRQVSGSRILVPDYLRTERRAVLENYVIGTNLTVEAFATKNGQTTPEVLDRALDDDVVMVYLENPTTEGVIEEHLDELGSLIEKQDSLFCLGSDLVALSLLQTPASVGADVVVGDASVLGLPTAYGMGLGIFACRDDYIRQVPGRLVGASEDAHGERTFTLTLQTREQHIRRERATSNICTNQAWVALRTAIHAAYLGPSGLISLAKKCHQLPEKVATVLDEIDGISAPIRDCHHFREFKASVESDAHLLADELMADGFAIHALNADVIQICVTEANERHVDDLAQSITEVLE